MPEGNIHLISTGNSTANTPKMVKAHADAYVGKIKVWVLVFLAAIFAIAYIYALFNKLDEASELLSVFTLLFGYLAGNTQNSSSV